MKAWEREIVRAAESLGVANANLTTTRRGGHLRLFGSVNGKSLPPIFLSLTPSDRRAILNVKSQIRRAVVAAGQPVCEVVR